MEIWKNIKKLRRERDMTQEELAETLAISPQAVSRWECGGGMPDIQLIPTLCNLFDVSSDSLLGIGVENKQKQIDEIVDKAHSFSGRGYLVGAREILEAGLKEFPNSDSLMRALMYLAYNQSNYGETDGKKKKYLNESSVPKI